MAAKKKTAAKTSAAKTATTAKAADTVKETAAKAADTAKVDTAKAETKSAAAEEKAEAPETKATAEKAVAKKDTKAPAKKTAKKAEAVQEVYVEWGNQQIQTDEIVNRIREKYVSEGHYAASIKSLKVYLNLEQRKAYYVINDKAEDQFVEF
ncbi:MAG: hypothetical protein IJ733_07295 [Lachnospiraceae bacterium]|nr:hypothetical protein [Lachnospiraceae bacterium]